MVALLLACTLLTASGAEGQAPPALQAALALEAAGDDAGALAALEALSRSRPTWELPRIEAARLLLKQGQQPARLQAQLDIAGALAPTNPRVHYLQGLFWEEQARPRAATRAFERALSYRADYEDARFRLGALYLEQGDWLKAELHYRLLTRARPQWLQVRLQLAYALEQQGRIEDAERELQALREAQPEHPLVLRRLAELYERSGRPQLAAPLRTQLERPAGQKPKRPLRPSRR
ncbi:MAG TPA: tetratricopeptide repeat protein [Aggregicoccus sp.]|nr:tetratricopeptide repeat protein [Aggregicoccus sp.]